ncbi:FAD-binding oxidoreductase [Stutzerimonas nitrititolerans]|uniref:FAD-binding oxidoreductase n=1 Tax=Stutzerimonas nitrititolerans TaxID=2482751 RepID=UPI00289D0B2E|nr:FAD-binding oxidoreductase [Stutzerimonas nitrititolerans]
MTDLILNCIKIDMSKITLSNGSSFVCQSEQTLLEAARAQGLMLEHSCRTGRCGVCKAHVLTGETLPLKEEESLTENERASGLVLTCCRTALTDTELDIKDLGELGSIEVKTLPCRIDSLALLSGDVIEVVLRTPPSSRLTYLSGQYVDVIGKNGLRRSYSIANAPREDGKIILQVRKVLNGEMSRYWFAEAQVNDLLRIEGPLGTFCLRKSQASHLVLLATGTGIAPIKAMLETLAANPSLNSYQQISLYWGGRTEKDIYWTPDFPGLDVHFTRVLSRTPSSGDIKGYVQDAALADGFDLQESIVYACGSEAMIESARKQLISAGLHHKNYHSDAFVSSN